MKNVVFFFDVGGDTSATALFAMLEESEDQVPWYHCESTARPRDGSVDVSRAAIRDAYDVLVQTWDPGDRILVFGAGRGGYTAQSFARLLDAVGMLPPMWSDLLGYVLDSYGLPRTPRTSEDWDLVKQLIVDLNDGADVALPVAYLGLWDAVRPPDLPPQPDRAPANVAAGRHAMAIEGGRLRHRTAPAPCGDIDEVWFRGGHLDVVGGAGACEQLVRIAADWMLDGALAAGVLVHDGSLFAPSSPAQDDALAGSVRSVTRRKIPVDASVHASVEVHLRAHPEYWRRLPARVVWADQEWLARGERLVVAEPAPAVVEQQELASTAS